MRVVFVLPGISDAPVGGYQVVYNYANFLSDELGLDVYLVHDPTITRASNSYLSHKEALQWGVIGIAKTLIRAIRQNHQTPTWFRLSPNVKSMSMPARLFTARDTDIIIATSVQTAHTVLKLTEHAHAHGFYFIQHYEVWSAPKDFVDSTWKLPLQKIVIAPWLVDIAHRLGEPAALVPNAMDSGAFPAGPDLDNRPSSVIAMVSPVPYKRTDLVCELFSLIADEYPDTKLSTFGICDKPDGLPEQCAHYKQPNHQTLSQLYQSNQVYVCTSDFEGWGLPPAEALISRCMVVSTDIGGVRSYADGTALFSPVGDTQLLFNNVKSVLQHPKDFQTGVDKARSDLCAYSPADAATRFATAIGAIEH